MMGCDHQKIERMGSAFSPLGRLESYSEGYLREQI